MTVSLKNRATTIQNFNVYWVNVRNYIDRTYDYGAGALVTDGGLDPLDELFTIARKTRRATH